MLGAGAEVTLAPCPRGDIDIPDRFMLYRNWVKLQPDEPLLAQTQTLALNRIATLKDVMSLKIIGVCKRLCRPVLEPASVADRR